MRYARLASLVIAATFMTAPASGEESAARGSTDDDRVQAAADAETHPTMQSKPRLHDGFYLRLSTGFGAYNERIDRPGQESHTSVIGVAHTADLAVGTTIRPGVVIGAGFWSTNVLASTTRTFEGEVMTSTAAQNPSSWVAGPWIDYYFDPRGGFHLPAGLGLAILNGIDVEGYRLSRHNDALGASMLVGLGYEWWISEQWSIGVLGRVSAIAATSQGDDGRRWIHLAGSAPSILFSATYN